MTIVDLTGVYKVDVVICGCELSEGVQPYRQLFREGWYPATGKHPESAVTFELLDFYRRFKVIGAVPVRVFVDVLEEMADPWQIDLSDDRYRIVGRLLRQWAFMQRVIRSGIQHDSGLETATSGALAVRCWACPQMGINLPANWKEVVDRYVLILWLCAERLSNYSSSYIHRPILAVDANFRQANKLRNSSVVDMPLYSGLGVQMPDEFYMEWMRTYVTEEEVCNVLLKWMHN